MPTVPATSSVLETQDPERGPVGTDEPRLQVFMDVGDRGFFEEIAVALLAFAQRSVKVQPHSSAAARAAKIRKMSSFRGSEGIGRSSNTARWPR